MFLSLLLLGFFAQQEDVPPNEVSPCESRGEWLGRATNVVVGRTESLKEVTVGKGFIEQRVTISTVRSLTGSSRVTIEFRHYRRAPSKVLFGRNQSAATQIGERAICFLRQEASGLYRSVCDAEEPYIALGKIQKNTPDEIRHSETVAEAVVRLQWRNGDTESVSAVMPRIIEVFGVPETAIAMSKIVSEGGADEVCVMGLRFFPGLGFRCSVMTDRTSPMVAELHRVDQKKEGRIAEMLEKSDQAGLEAFGMFRGKTSWGPWEKLLAQHPNAKIRLLARRYLELLKRK